MGVGNAGQLAARYWWVVLLVILAAAGAYLLLWHGRPPLARACSLGSSLECGEFRLDSSMRLHLTVLTKGKAMTVTGIACTAQKSGYSFSDVSVPIGRQGSASVTGAGVQCLDEQGKPAQQGKDYAGQIYIRYVNPSIGQPQYADGTITYPAR